MKMDQKFLTEDPGSWNDQPGCLMARILVQGIQVTNDAAERGVTLIQIQVCNQGAKPPIDKFSPPPGRMCWTSFKTIWT